MVTALKWNVGALALLVASTAWAQQSQPTQQRAKPAQPPQAQPGQAQQAPAGQRLQTQQPGQQRLGGQQNLPAPQGQQRTALRPVEGQVGETTADREIASWLLLSNEVEVQLAQLAVKQAEHKQVKQFAERMIQDHGNMINELRQFAPDAPGLGTSKNRIGQVQQNAREEGQAQQSTPDRALGNRPIADPNKVRTTIEQNTTAGRSTERGEGHQGLPVAQISHQLAERCLASMQQELGRKQGAHFDKAYIGSQVFEHMNMLNTLETLRSYASPQLASNLDQAIQHTQSHLQEAKQICEQLDGGQNQGEARQGRTSDREQQAQKEVENQK